MKMKPISLLLFLIIFASSLGIAFEREKKSEPKKEGKISDPVKTEEKEEIDSRKKQRAFYTAPPVIPHAVASQNSKDCLACHLEVTKLEDRRVAMKTPHPQFFNCLQCHVDNSVDQSADQFATDWLGLAEPKLGERGYLVSPPMIPHRVFMRENCISCHSPTNPNKTMRTPHPERTQCVQCHVVDKEKEF